MQLDRSRFLLLTSTMAAAACASEPPPPQAPVVVAAPPSTAQGIGMADLPSVYRQHPTDDPMAEPAGPDGAPEGEVELLSGESAGEPSALAARCQTLRPPPGPHCEDFEWTRSLCETFDQTMQPRVAEAAVDCIMTHDRRQTLCTPTAREQCFLKAIAKAPAVQADQGECSTIAARCGRGRGGPSLKGCRRAVAAMKPAYREAMLTCISEGCAFAECVYAAEP